MNTDEQYTDLLYDLHEEEAPLKRIEQNVSITSPTVKTDPLTPEYKEFRVNEKGPSSQT